MKIILVCLANIQTYIVDCVKQLLLFGNDDIIILTDCQRLRDELILLFHNHHISFPENIIHVFSPQSVLCESFDKYSRLCHLFRNGLYKYCFKRFIFIHDYMKQYDLQNVIHIENDVMIYRNLNSFHNLYDKDIWLVRDHIDRCVPSIMFFKDYLLLEKCLFDIDYHDETIDQNDMKFWATCAEKYQKQILELPLIHTDDLYNDITGIFDASAIGQYLGGIDPFYTYNHDTRGFMNPSCRVDYRKYKFHWKFDKNENLWYPILWVNDLKKEIKINNIHVHCKLLYKYSSRPLSKDELENLYITF